MAARVDLRGVDAGSTLDRSFVWYEPLLDEHGVVMRDPTTGLALPDRDHPINLTGLTARMQIRRAASSPDVMLELTTGNGGIILGGATGRITLYAPAADTEGLVSGVYDLELLSDDDPPRVARLIQGKVRVSGEVTR